MLNFFTLNTSIELICFLIALVCLINDKSLVWKSGILYLLIVCIIEMAGIYIRKQHHHNSWVYNILLVFEAGYVSIMFRVIFNKYFNSRLIVIAGLAVTFLLYSYELYQHGIGQRNHLTNILIAVLFVLYSLYYYYLLLKDEAYINLKNTPEFWWVTGVLMYYFGDVACDVFYPLLTKILIIPDNAFKYIYRVLNVLLYSFWSYSFICKKWLITTSKNL